MTSPQTLAAGFPAATRADWLAQVERTLKGAPLESLTRRSLEGLPMSPLYDAAGLATAPAKAAQGWEIRSRVADAAPAAANEAALADLAGGAESLLVRIDPTGAHGVAVGDADGLARVLDGVLLDVAPVALDAGFLGPRAADWLGAAAKGAPAARLSLHLDPLSAYAIAGASPGPIEAHLIASANVAARLAQTYPRAELFLTSGRAVHEAGGGEAAELAFAAAAGVAYAKALVRAGAPMADALAGVVLGVSLDADVIWGVAKLRAARRVWARIADACGANPAARIEARSSRRMLTRADAWTNMIRLTAAAFAGAVGGADALVLGAFTDALGPPTAFARRQARNAQLVLREEAHLGRVVDPAAGSGALEALTEELAAAAWVKFQAIEAAGGAVKALEAGLVAGWAAEGRAELARRLADKDLRLLGVTDFPGDGGRAADVAPTSVVTPASAPPARLPGPDSHCPVLTPIRLEDLA
ncbi:MAG TPA: methylmalonyl-CoA mutase family protein [Caulobacteraceae bacterium]|jgi:methylmalonyl-CoA mutase